MYKINRLLIVFAVVLLGVVAGACSHTESRQKVEELVAQFNSDEFQENVRKQPMFESSEAKIDGDTLVIVFNGKPQIRFSNKNRLFVDAQRKSTIDALHAGVEADAQFRSYFEAMDELGMGYKMVLRGADGSEASIIISPAEVLQKVQ